MLALHLLPTGLSPLRNAVSQYGISNYRLGYRVQTIAYAVAGLGAAIGISAFSNLEVVVGLCGVFALARLLISWFPMDVPGSTRTKTGRRHGVLAIGAFAAVGLAAAQLSRDLNQDHLRGGIARASGSLALLMLICFLGMTVARRTRGGYFGLVERAFYCCMTAWLIAVAVLVAA